MATRRRADNADDDEPIRDRRTNSPVIVSTVRVIEAVVIAGITALIVHVYSIPKLEEKLETQNRQIAELKQEMADFRRDFYTPRKLAAYEPVKDKNGN